MTISSARPRRGIALALLATTALATLAGGCTQTSPFGRSSDAPKLSAADAVGAIAQWSAAYAKEPNNPKMALGYAQALKAIGSRERALEVLTACYRANPTNGELASELGRLGLEMDRLDIAGQTLKVAEVQGIRDWKTLSAQGTLRAKQGKHAEAQQYFLAALQEQPDAVSVINNLALSYALDGKPQRSEELLRKAVASGHNDRRVRQNLALVLGLQGKFEEARQVAAVDMTQQEAKTSLAYLRNMVSAPTQFAAARPGTQPTAEDDWSPFASEEGESKTASMNPVSAAPAAQKSKAIAAPAVASSPASPKMQTVKAADEITAPKSSAGATTSGASAKAGKQQLAGTPTLITPIGTLPAQSKQTPTAQTNQNAPATLLRTDTE